MGTFHKWNRPQYLRAFSSASTQFARAARTPAIQPAWVNTVKDHTITDCAHIKNMSDIGAPDSSDLLCLLRSRFNENGVVHMRNTRLTEDLTSMRAWALNIMGGARPLARSHAASPPPLNLPPLLPRAFRRVQLHWRRQLPRQHRGAGERVRHGRAGRRAHPLPPRNGVHGLDRVLARALLRRRPPGRRRVHLPVGQPRRHRRPAVDGHGQEARGAGRDLHALPERPRGHGRDRRVQPLAGLVPRGDARGRAGDGRGARPRGAVGRAAVHENAVPRARLRVLRASQAQSALQLGRRRRRLVRRVAGHEPPAADGDVRHHVADGPPTQGARAPPPAPPLPCCPLHPRPHLGPTFTPSGR